MKIKTFVGLGILALTLTSVLSVKASFPVWAGVSIVGLILAMVGAMFLPFSPDLERTLNRVPLWYTVLIMFWVTGLLASCFYEPRVAYSASIGVVALIATLFVQLNPSIISLDDFVWGHTTDSDGDFYNYMEPKPVVEPTEGEGWE